LKTYTRSRRAEPVKTTVTYYATTETQSKTTASSIICAVAIPADLSPFRQQCHALKYAKLKHFNQGIVGVVERSKLPIRTQLAVSKSKPSYTWKDNPKP
jgi:hypothetical protein